MGELLGPLDDSIIIFLQGFSPLLDLFFAFVTSFGDEFFLIAFVVIIFYCIDKKIAIRVAFLTSVTGFIVVSLKGFFGLERPYIASSSIKGIPDLLGHIPDDYTFPSGHSSTAGSFWSYLAYKWKNNKPFVIFAIFLIIMVPLSRNYLGVHWPTDSIIGVTLGIVMSALLIYFEPQILTIINKMSKRNVIILSGVASILMVVIADILILLTGHLISLADTSATAGLFFGLTIGVLLEEKYVGLDIEKAKNNKKILIYRILLGLVLVLGITFGLKAIFSFIPTFDSDFIAQLIRYCRYVILVVIAVFVIPFVFKKIEKD